MGIAYFPWEKGFLPWESELQVVFIGIYNKDRESIISFYYLTYQGLKAYVKFQVLSHFERYPGFDKKRCVKIIPGVLVMHLTLITINGYYRIQAKIAKSDNISTYE